MELFGHVKEHSPAPCRIRKDILNLRWGYPVLDEVGNLSLEVQATLLRVIQSVSLKDGWNKEMNVDVRIIVASNESLQMV